QRVYPVPFEPEGHRWGARVTSGVSARSPITIHRSPITPMKLVVAMTGASGAIYTQRLLDNLEMHEVHFISTKHSREVAQLELPKGELKISSGVIRYDENDSMFVPFVSVSAKFEAMAVIPASTGT